MTCHAALTLVTCAYDWDGARTVVIAVRQACLEGVSFLSDSYNGSSVVY